MWRRETWCAFFVFKLAEKRWQELTEDLFGVAEEEGPGGVTNPKTKTEFEAYGTIIGKKVAGHFEAVHYGTMLKALLREAFLESSSTVRLGFELR